MPSQALEKGIFDPAKYKYFILLNSSVRGPFLPPYWPVSSGGAAPVWSFRQAA